MMIRDLQQKKEKCLNIAKRFCVGVSQSQKQTLRSTVISSKARVRKGSKVGNSSCPIRGCKGVAFNIKRHMAQCHKDLSEAERNHAIALQKKLHHLKAVTEGKAPPTKRMKGIKSENYSPSCIFCNKSVKRLDTHARRVHLLKKNLILSTST